jgi:hypothetical protein
VSGQRDPWKQPRPPLHLVASDLMGEDVIRLTYGRVLVVRASQARSRMFVYTLALSISICAFLGDRSTNLSERRQILPSHWAARTEQLH